MVLIYGEFTGHSIMGIFLTFRNVLVLLKLWHVKGLRIKIYPFCGNKMHSHVNSIS